MIDKADGLVEPDVEPQQPMKLLVLFDLPHLVAVA